MYEAEVPPTLSGPAMVVEPAIVTFPVFDTAKSVEVAQIPVEEEMLKSVPNCPGVVVGDADIDMSANGEVVPTPILPCPVIVVVPVAPKTAFEAVSMRLNMLVPVAFANKKLPVEVMLVANKFPVVNAVEEAYGNCEAATVELEKKTPWVQMLEVVAAVVVPKFVSVVNGYAAMLADVR